MRSRNQRHNDKDKYSSTGDRQFFSKQNEVFGGLLLDGRVAGLKDFAVKGRNNNGQDGNQEQETIYRADDHYGQLLFMDDEILVASSIPCVFHDGCLSIRMVCLHRDGCFLPVKVFLYICLMFMRYDTIIPVGYIYRSYEYGILAMFIPRGLKAFLYAPRLRVSNMFLCETDETAVVGPHNVIVTYAVCKRRTAVSIYSHTVQIVIRVCLYITIACAR